MKQNSRKIYRLTAIVLTLVLGAWSVAPAANVYEAFSLNDRTQTGKVIANFTIDFCKNMAGEAVSQTGMALTELGVGKYVLMNPNVTERTVCSGYLTADSTKSFSLMFDPVDGDIAKEATLTGMKGGTFNASTDSLEAIRDRGDSAWITATGLSLPVVMQGQIYTAVAAQSREVVIIRGDTPRITFDLGADYTAWTPKFGAKASPADTAYIIAIKDCTWSNAALGQGYVDLTATETAAVAKLSAEIELRNGNQRLTAVKFFLSIREDVIR